METNIHFLSYLAQFLEWKIFQTICRENQNTHFRFNNFFFSRKSCLLWYDVEKYGRARHATDKY